MNTPANAILLELLSQAVEQAHGHYGMVTLVQLNSTFGAMPINPDLKDLTLFGVSVGTFFMDGQFVVPQACTFPISGQYGFPSRLSFYTLL
ncbi:hypothetical protein N7G274_007268 [Stereocaulon virgatum]|uniref:Uncharacterized protein n=1 Tax=Stereocaulon virgatum TaxID=373712 RepID=A0ABR4A1P3_9LECA